MTPTPAPKKKMSPWAWVAIGCGAIAVLAILAIGGTVAAGGWFLTKQVNKYEANPAVAAAELLIRANPDVELVESSTIVQMRRIQEAMASGGQAPTLPELRDRLAAGRR